MLFCPAMRSRSAGCPIAPVSLCLASLAGLASGQCGPQLEPGFGCPGVNNRAAALVDWDPDGAGPAPAVVVIGGWFGIAGTTAAPGLATWNPATGSFAALPALPSPPNGRIDVQQLATLPNGELVVAYYDWSVGAGQVARGNGQQWTVLGASFDDLLLALHVRPNGDLLVGGQFSDYGGTPIRGLARWNGVTWQPVGAGLDGPVYGLTDDANGDLLVSGAFTTAGGVATSGAARWNGAAWSSLGGAVPVPRAIAVTAGRTFAATEQGFFELVAGSWIQVPGLVSAPLPQPPLSTAVRRASGRILVGGTLSSVAGQATNHLAEFDPATNTFAALGAGVGQISLAAQPVAVDLANGDLLVGGTFATAGGVTVANLARWNGSQWSAIADGPAQPLACGLVLDGARFVVGGTFAGLGNVAAANVAEWNGSAWVPLGSGLGGPVSDLVRLPNGDLVAVGAFATTGSGAVARGIARWDGTAWTEVGGGLQYFGIAGVGYSALVRDNGELVVAGNFTGAGGAAIPNLAVWNGVAWSGLAGGFSSAAAHLTRAANGDLLVASSQVVAGSNLATVFRWDGSAWSSVASLQPSEGIVDLAPLPDGGVVVAGTRSLFYGTSSRGVIEYVGASTSFRVESLEHRSRMTGIVRLPGGDLLVSGSFSSLALPFGPVVAVANEGCVRITTNGLFVPAPPLTSVQDADAFPNGDRLLVGGMATGSVNFVGRLTTPCPATASAGGVGCTGSGGLNVLESRELPWLGGVCTSVASGMPLTGIALAVRGLGTAATPLASILPQGLPGCSLLVTPDLLDASVPNAGTVAASFVIPNVTALVGATLHQQVVALELATGGAIAALTATNRLTLTIGSY
jgi:hypothetical protein